MKKLSIVLTTVAALGLGLTACKKKEEAAPPVAAEPAAPAQAEPTTPPAAEPPKAAEPAPAAQAPAVEADYIQVLATHAEPKPTDPVVVSFEKFSVVKADFDPAKVEGGKAEIEIDLTSLKTDSPKRDAHLGSPDYIDSAKFAKATVKIDNVKKSGEKTFTADATVSLHGVEKKYPVTFEVVETLPDGIRVKGEHKFQRLDFKVGKAKDDSVASDLTIKLQLTLKKA